MFALSDVSDDGTGKGRKRQTYKHPISLTVVQPYRMSASMSQQRAASGRKAEGHCGG